MTTPPSQLDDLAATLTAFMKAIGVSVPPAETTDDIKYPTSKLKLTQSDEARLTELDAAFQDLLEKFEQALTLQLKFGADELSDADYTAAKLKSFVELVGNSPLDFYLKIDKKMLATQLNLKDSTADIKLFLSSDALVQALNKPLTELEKGDGLFRGFTGEKKLIILVANHEIELNGEYLAVLGGAAAGKWQDYLPSSKPADAAKKISSLYAEATAKLKWDEIHLSYLTPLQLLVSWKKSDSDIGPPPPATDKISKSLYSQLLSCSLLYLATSSKPNGPANSGAAALNRRNLLFTFSEDKYLAWITVGSNQEVGDTLIKGNQNNPWEAPLKIGELVEWVYKEERGIAVRRSLSQAVIAVSVQASKPPDGLLELIKRAPEIKERVLARWAAFMDERLKEYFANVKALEEVVDATSKSYSDQVQSLTKTLIENMLAAVAVVIGSFLAAIFKSPFDSKIFVVGTTTYMVYLVIFPVLIGLTIALQQYRRSKDLFEKQKRDFGARLTDTEVNRIVGGGVRSQERWFENWFAGTTVIYVIAIELMVIAIFTAPNAVKRWTDDFTLTSASYNQPVEGRTVPIVIRGENFDKDKQITVSVAGSQFSNTGEPSVTVHGSTVLTLAPTRQELQAAISKNNRELKVRQGSSSESIAQLPQGPLPSSPNPVFEHWNWVVKDNDRVATGVGSNFDSIVKVAINGVPCPFQSSENGKQIELYGLGKASLVNANATLGLTDGREITVPIVLSR